MALELLIAAAVILAVSLANGQSPAGSSARASTPAPSHTWSTRALPVLTSLVDDLTVSDARVALLSDDARAHSLGSPGDGLDAEWSGVLSRVDEAAGNMGTQSGQSQSSQSQPSQSQQRVEALNALISFVASLERRPG